MTTDKKEKTKTQFYHTNQLIYPKDEKNMSGKKKISRYPCLLSHKIFDPMLKMAKTCYEKENESLSFLTTTLKKKNRIFDPYASKLNLPTIPHALEDCKNML